MTFCLVGVAALAAAALISACAVPAPSGTAPVAPQDLDAADDLMPRFVAADGDRIAVAGVANTGGSGAVSYSLDAGRTWIQRDTGYGEPTGLAISGDLLWMTVACDGDACLLASQDEGRTWRDLGRGASVSPSLASATDGAVITREANGKPVVEFTDDGGENWRRDAKACAPTLVPGAIVIEADRRVVACVTRLDEHLRSEGTGWELLTATQSGWTTLYTTADGLPDRITTSTLNRLVMHDALGFMDHGWITENGGLVWAGYQPSGRISGTEQPRIGAGGPGAIGTSGEVYGLFTIGMDRCVLERSDDRGATWKAVNTWDERWLR